MGRKAVAIVITFLWFAMGSYTGVAGLIHDENQRKQNAIEESSGSGEHIEYDGIEFTTHGHLLHYLNEMKADYFFWWTDYMPELLMLAISSCGLGAFGGVINIMRLVAFKKVPIEETSYIAIPFMGFLLGMVILAISYVLPALIVSDENLQIRQTTLMCFSLFVGLFSSSFLIWLELTFGNYLKKTNDVTVNEPQTDGPNPEELGTPPA
jgi:hypothetical protein